MGVLGRALGQASPRETCRWLATSTQAQAWGEIFWCQTGTLCQSGMLCQSPPPPPPFPLPASSSPRRPNVVIHGFPPPFRPPVKFKCQTQARGRQSACARKPVLPICHYRVPKFSSKREEVPSWWVWVRIHTCLSSGAFAPPWFTPAYHPKASGTGRRKHSSTRHEGPREVGFL